MPRPDELFAVTTRSRLKGPWRFPQMMYATLRVRRQLKGTGVVEWASVVASPAEFWTITVWRSRHDMQEFMRSGAHDEIMWSFSKLLKSFWLMRWRPGPHEIGTWKGRAMAQPEPSYERQPPATAKDEALQMALDHLPKLKAAAAADGSVGYATSPYARRSRAEVGGAGGVVVHLATPAKESLHAYRALRSLRAFARRDPHFLRGAVGVGKPGQSYLLCLWGDRAGSRAFLDSVELKEVVGRWPAGAWANEWFPENEFGHWDGLRLRQQNRRYAIPVPHAARQAAGLPGRQQ